MKTFMIIAQVNGIDYLTKIKADSASAAEHRVLDMGVAGKHTYGVTYCMAYDEEAMKTDCFIYSALQANPVSMNELCEIIREQNDSIREKDAAEDRIIQIEKQIRDLKEELQKAKEIIG